MYCVHCGAQLDETMRFCPQCGASINSTPDRSSLDGAESPLNASYENPYASAGNYDRSPSYASESSSINDYLLWNVLATLFCCIPCGIAGIVFSCLSNSAKGRGDFETAARNAHTAKTLFWISFGAGLAVVLVYSFIIAVGAFAEVVSDV